jgi:hypothetical protein
MKKVILLALLGISSIVSTPALAKDPPRLELAADDANRIDELDLDCRHQLKLQRPSMLKNIFLTEVRTVPFAVAGGMLGSALGGFAPHGSSITDLNYGEYNGGATVGNSAGGGIMGYESAKHTAQAGCMSFMSGKARLERPALTNVGIIYNSYQANGHALLGANGKRLGKGDYFVVIYHPEHPDDEAAEFSQDEQSSAPAPQYEQAPPPQ